MSNAQEAEGPEAQVYAFLLVVYEYEALYIIFAVFLDACPDSYLILSPPIR